MHGGGAHGRYAGVWGMCRGEVPRAFTWPAGYADCTGVVWPAGVPASCAFGLVLPHRTYYLVSEDEESAAGWRADLVRFRGGD